MNENEAPVAVATMQMVRRPSEVLAEATKAAEALAAVIKNKRNPVIFNGEQYLEFEDWQTCGKFYSLTAKIAWTRVVEIGGALGFEAGADVIDNRSGMVISSAEAMCLNDEDKWSKRTKYEYNPETRKREKVGEVPVPLFQLRSMAQTRACAKALRNVLAWVVVLAGFKPNVAEEMTGDEMNGDRPENPKANVSAPKRKSEAAPAPQPPPAEEPAQDQEPPADGASWRERLREALGGDTEELQRLTSFFSKRDNKQVAGKRRFEWVSEQAAEIAFHRWEEEQKGGMREPGQD